MWYTNEGKTSRFSSVTKSPMQPKTNQAIGFFILLVLFLVLTAFLLSPFVELLALSAILATLFLPLRTFLTHRVKNDYLAVSLTLLVIITIVALPLYFLSQAAVKEMIYLYSQYTSGTLHLDQQVMVSHLPIAWQARAILLIEAGTAKVISWARSFALDFQGVASNIAGFFFALFILLFSTFYFLKDYRRLKRYFDGLFPLSTSQEDLLISKVTRAINGVVKGNFLTAVLQGGTAIIGFLLAGLDQPLLWTLAVMITAFVPPVGSSLVIVPAIIYLLLFKSTTAAIILGVWFVVVHLGIDNVVGPKLVSSQTQLHPLLALLSVLGGIQVFGAVGILFGPIIMAMCIALVDVYKADFIATIPHSRSSKEE